MRSFESGATAEHVPTERVPRPVYDTTDFVVAAPQEVARQAQPSPLVRFLPIVTAIATVGAMAVAYYSRSAVVRNPAFLIFPLMMLVSTVTTVISNADRRRGAINAERADYLGYLSDVRADVVNTAAAQHQSLFWCHPDPDTLWTLVGGCRMWERRVSDSDFCQVRIGLGTLPLATRLVPPTMEATSRLDPVAVTALHRFLRTHSTVPNLPITLALREVAAVSVGGDMTYARALLRATICQLAVMHSPRLVLIAAAVSDHNRRHWDWLKWLPHNRHPYINDDVGPARLVYASLAAAMEALAGMTADRPSADPLAPHVVVVVDGDVDDTERVNSAAGKAITTLTIDDPALVGTLRLRVSDSEVVVGTSIDDEVAARPDAMSYTAALACAQRLAGYRASGMDTSKPTDWSDLIGIGDVTSFVAGTMLDRQKAPRSAACSDRDHGCGCTGGAGHQRGCRERNGATRALHRGNRFRQIGVLANSRVRHDGLPFTRGSQPGPHRLQRRRNIRRARAGAACRRCHHEPV